MFGGNSNWRGPIWVPINTLVIRALELLGAYYGDAFTVELPTGSGHFATLAEVARDLAQRLERIFIRDANGRRPVYGGTEKFQTDPHWRDLILFYEYFHGDNGAGHRRQPPDRLDRLGCPAELLLRSHHREPPDSRGKRHGPLTGGRARLSLSRS